MWEESSLGKGNGLCKDGHEPICLRKARKLRHMSESEVSQKGRRGLIIKGHPGQSDGRHWRASNSGGHDVIYTLSRSQELFWGECMVD